MMSFMSKSDNAVLLILYVAYMVLTFFMIRALIKFDKDKP